MFVLCSEHGGRTQQAMAVQECETPVSYVKIMVGARVISCRILSVSLQWEWVAVLVV